MGKRTSNSLDNPSLIETNCPPLSRRKMSLTSCSSAALTLLALKQESRQPSSCASSQDGRGSMECDSVQSKNLLSDDCTRTQSMCSSVTDDDGSISEDELATSLNYSRFDTAKSGHSLIRMALVRPQIRVVSCKNKVALPTPSFTSWKVPPEGRPLPAPGRFPRGFIISSESSSTTHMMK